MWNQDCTELAGTLRRSDLEGGFWVLDFGDADAPHGGSVVLGTPELPAGARAGARMRVVGHVVEGGASIFMAGARFALDHAEVLDPSDP